MNNQAVWGIGGIVVLLMLVVGARGCGHYGEVNSTTYEYGKALYSVCNRRDAERLEKVAAMIDSAMENGKISKTEARSLQGIVNEARAHPRRSHRPGKSQHRHPHPRRADAHLHHPQGRKKRWGHGRKTSSPSASSKNSGWT